MTGNPSGCTSSAPPNIGTIGNPTDRTSSAPPNIGTIGNPTDRTSSAPPNIGTTGTADNPAKRRTRSIALFPGAFRPPHVNHYETVRQLAERPDIDEVVVIISNRPRTVPGTTKALGEGAPLRIWEIYLRTLDGVKLETAAGSAVAVAAERVRSAKPGDRFLLVFGDPDLATGRERFGKALRARPDGVDASVERGAPNLRPVRATEMRALLAQGDEAFNAFRRSLPDHLTDDEQWEVWATCRAAMVDRTTLTATRISQILQTNGLQPAGRIMPAGSPKTDQVYRTTLADRTPVFVKYADDAPSHSSAVSASGSGGQSSRKSRRRLKAERQALKWVHGNVESPVQTPEVACFDKTRRTLALSAVCPGGRRLSDALRTGTLDPTTAHAAGRFLAAAHTAAPPDEPFWDDLEDDRLRWRTALAGITEPPAWSDNAPASLESSLNSKPPSISHYLARLADSSSSATSRGFCHLDYSPTNILCGPDTVGVIDFESSTTVGDPAFDLATQLGHYLTAGFSHRGRGDLRAIIEAVLGGYRSLADDRWTAMAPRVAAFTAATALQLASPPSLPGSPPAGSAVRPPPAVVRSCRHLLSLLDEQNAEAIYKSLIDCVADSQSIADPATSPSRTVRRRSLKAVSSLCLWEGSLIEHSQQGLTTVAVHGGRPWSMIDIIVDGVWVTGSRLDSIGSGTAIVSATSKPATIEISDLDEKVLEGLLSPLA